MGIFSDVRFLIGGLVEGPEKLPSLLIRETLTPMLQAVEEETDALTILANQTVIERQRLQET